jgi:hypothetical protein
MVNMGHKLTTFILKQYEKGKRSRKEESTKKKKSKVSVCPFRACAVHNNVILQSTTDSEGKGSADGAKKDKKPKKSKKATVDEAAAKEADDAKDLDEAEADEDEDLEQGEV